MGEQEEEAKLKSRESIRTGGGNVHMYVVHVCILVVHYM